MFSAIDKNLCAWVCDDNKGGKLGNRDPVKVESLSNIRSIDSCCTHKIFLDCEGNVYSCGENVIGQLGHPGSEYINVPTKISNLPCIESVACGYYNNILLDTDGGVWVLGKQKSEAYGCKRQNLPIKLDYIPRIKSIHSDGIKFILKDEEDVLWAKSSHFNVTGSDDRFYDDNFHKIENIPPIEKIRIGSYHSIYISTDGDAWSCGSNVDFQLGYKMKDRSGPKKIENLPKVLDACCMIRGSNVLDYEGKVWGFGYHKSTPEIMNFFPKIISVASGGHFDESFLLDECENVWIYNNANKEMVYEPDACSNFKKIKYVSTRCNKSFFLDVNGNMWAYGSNRQDQLGIGKTYEECSFVKIPTMINLENILTCGNDVFENTNIVKKNAYKI